MNDGEKKQPQPGQPAYYSSPEVLSDNVDAYFKWIEGETKEVEVEIQTSKGKKEKVKQIETVRYPDPPTITGLCLFLGFESRQSFYDYQERTEFSYTVKRARLKIETEYEKSLHRQSPTGAIFALKNMGWSDKTEIDQKTELSGSVAFNGIKIMKPHDPTP